MESGDSEGRMGRVNRKKGGRRKSHKRHSVQFQETEEPLDRQLPFPLKPETFVVHSLALARPQVLVKGNCSRPAGQGCPSSAAFPGSKARAGCRILWGQGPPCGWSWNNRKDWMLQAVFSSQATHSLKPSLEPPYRN